MKDFTITPLNLEKDLPIISAWDDEFKYDTRYDTIRRFILEDNTYFGIAEVIDVNYEKFPIGNKERSHALTIKNQDNEIMGFLLSIIIDLDTNDPELIIQYIALHPNHQGKGLGKKVIKELLDNSDKYFGTKIKKFFAKVDIDNYASRKMFESLGFELNYTNTRYLKATKSQLISEKI